MKSQAPAATANKHNSAPHQISIKYHTKGLFTSVPIIQHLGLSTKNYTACKKENKNSEETKQASEQDLDVTEMLELSYRGFFFFF